jgi:hypothetical protein
MARCQKSESVKRFFSERPQRAKQENWQGVAKSSGKTAKFSLLATLWRAVSRDRLQPVRPPVSAEILLAYNNHQPRFQVSRLSYEFLDLRGISRDTYDP